MRLSPSTQVRPDRAAPSASAMTRAVWSGSLASRRIAVRVPPPSPGTRSTGVPSGVVSVRVSPIWGWMRSSSTCSRSASTTMANDTNPVGVSPSGSRWALTFSTAPCNA